MKKVILCIMFTMLLIGCRKVQLTEKEYSKIVEKNYKKDSSSKRILVNKKYEDDKYYKYKIRRRYNKKGIYLIVNENKTFHDTTLFLAINNKTRKWIYINSILFTNKDTNEELFLNFDIENVEESYWKDGVTFFGGVYEKMIFSIDTDIVDKFENIFSTYNVSYILYSDYDDRSYKRKMDKKEIKYINRMLRFYRNKIIDGEKLREEEIIKRLEEEKQTQLEKNSENKDELNNEDIMINKDELNKEDII